MAAPTLSGLTDVDFENGDVLNTPQLIDADVTFADADGDVAGGTLVVGGLAIYDVISLRTAGTLAYNSATGEISVNGVVIGTATGGAGEDFVVTFNAQASVAAVEAVIEHLTFATTSAVPTASRDLSITFTDAAGNDAHGLSTFTQSATAFYNGPQIQRGAALGDVDGDGDMDLISVVDGFMRFARNDGTVGAPSFATPGSGGINVTGTMTFPDKGTPTMFYGGAALSFADMDGDNDLDIIASENGAVRYFRNNGAGGGFVANFVEQTGGANPFASAPANVSIVMADMDGDGDLDMVAGGNVQMRYFQNTGTATAAVFTERTGGANPFDGIGVARFVLADFDGDGDVDFLIPGSYASSYLENVGGAFLTPTTVFGGITSSGGEPAISVGDIDGDGALDFILANGYGGQPRLYLGSNTPLTITVDINVTSGVGDVGPTRAFAWQGAATPQRLDSDVAVHTPTVDLAGGRVVVTGMLAEDTVGIQLGGDLTIDKYGILVLYGSIPIGTFSGGAGGSLTVFLDASATQAGVEALIEHLTFTNSAAAPTLNRTLTITLFSASNAVLAAPQIAVTVNPEPVAPDLTEVEITGLLASVSFTETGVRSGPQRLDADVSFHDAADNFDGGSLTVSGLLAEDRISLATGAITVDAGTGAVSYNGAIIGTASGGEGATFSVTLNAAADSEAIEALIEALAYANDSVTPTGDRTLTLNLVDSLGNQLIRNTGPGPVTIEVHVDPVFDLVTTLGIPANLSFVENDLNDNPPRLLITDPVELTMYEAFGFGGVTLEIVGVAGDQFTLQPTQFVDYWNATNPLEFSTYTSGGATYLFFGSEGVGVVYGLGTDHLSIAFNTGPSEATILERVEILLTHVLYASSDNNPAASHTVEIRLADANGDVIAPVTINVAISPRFEHVDLTGLTTALTFGEQAVNAGPQLIDADVTFGDGYDDIAGGSLTVTGLSAQDRVAISSGGPIAVNAGQVSYNGVIFGTMTGGVGGTLTVAFNSLATDAAVEALIEHLTYANVSHAPSLNRTLSINLSDGAAHTSSRQVVVTVIAQEDVPVLTDVNPTLNVSEHVVNNVLQLIDASVTFTDPEDRLGFSRDGSLVVSGLLAEDTVTLLHQGNGAGQVGFNSTTGIVSYGGVAVGVAHGGDGHTFVVDFYSTARPVAIDAVIQRLAYSNSSDSPTGSRTFSIEFFEGFFTDQTFGHNTGAADPFAGVSTSIAAPRVAAGDVDRDGDIDIVSIDGATGALHYLENVGTVDRPSFVERTGAANPFSGINGGAAANFRLFDFDGDGDVDLVGGSAAGGTTQLRYFRNVAVGGPAAFTELTGFSNPFRNMSGDGLGLGFDSWESSGNTIHEAYLIDPATGVVHAYRSFPDQGSPEFGYFYDLPTNSPTFAPGSDLSAGNTNADAYRDLVLISQGSLQLLMEASGGYHEQTGYAYAFPTALIGQATGVVIADLDNDGFDDVIVGLANGQLVYLTRQGALATVTINVSQSIDRPVLTDLAASVTYDEFNARSFYGQQLDASVNFDAPIVPGGQLTVSGLLAEDVVHLRLEGDFLSFNLGNGQISYSGTVIGVATGGEGSTLVITFNANAGAGHVGVVIQALRYTNTSDHPTESRTLTINFTDVYGVSMASPPTIAVNLNVAADPVELTGLSGPTFTQIAVNGGLQLIDSDVTVSSLGVTHTTLTISGLLAEDTVSILPVGDGAGEIGFNAGTGEVRYGGVVIGTASGGVGATLTVALNSAATVAALEALIERLAFANASGNPTPLRTLSLDIVDGATPVLTGGAQSIVVHVAPTPVVSTGDGGGNTLGGQNGDDHLDGGAGDDELDGGEGGDYLKGGLGADAMTGGLGDDIYIVDDLGDVADETGGGGIDKVRASISWTIGTGIENLDLLSTGGAIDGTGNSLDNVITGNSYDNVIGGLDGADTLIGGGGIDTLDGGAGADSLAGDGGNDILGGDAGIDDLVGGAGNDRLDGGAEADDMTGGAGNDVFVVDDAGDAVIEFAAGGTDTVESSITWGLGADVEHLTLTGTADIDGTGNGLRNTINGNGGANVLSGGGEIDTINGGDGADTLNGDAGNDLLNGGADADLLRGGAGADKLTGGTGGDAFVFTGADVHFSGLGEVVEKDQILDLAFGQGDWIDLSAIDANSVLGGDQAFAFVTRFTKAAGQAVLKFAPTTGKTTLELDVDGDGKADLRIELNGDVTGTTANAYTGGADLDGGWIL